MSSKNVLFKVKYKNDGYLWLVLVEIPDQYVVWDFNNTTNGYFSGHYFTTIGSAIVKFLKKIEESSLLDIDDIEKVVV